MEKDNILLFSDKQTKNHKTYSLHRRSAAREFHTHPSAQLSFTVEGILHVTAENKKFAVPPHMAIFIPKGVRHKNEMSKDLMLESIYFSDYYTKHFPKSVTLLKLNSWAEALIHKICANDTIINKSSGKKLLSLLTEELQQTETVPWAQLTLPEHHKLLKIYQLFKSAKGKFPSLSEAAEYMHITPRTLLRLFRKETGMSYILWKQQFLYIKALEWLPRYKNIGKAARTRLSE